MKIISKISIVLVMFVSIMVSLIAGQAYRISGVLQVRGTSVALIDESGRTFILKVKASKVAKFNNEMVQVDGVAKNPDKPHDISVKKMRPSTEIIKASQIPYNKMRRPAKLVSKTKEALKVKNVRWSFLPKKDINGETHTWTTATIKPSLVENAYFILKPFPPEWLAAHSFMLFTFKPGGLIDAKGNESKGLVISIEAYLRDKEKYSLQQGLKNKFSIVWTVCTWEDYAAETFTKNSANKKFWPYKITFSKTNLQKLLVEGMKKASINRDGEYYHTTRNNCTNNLVIMLNKFSNKKIRFWTVPKLVYNVRTTMPNLVPAYLLKKGVVGRRLTEVNAKNFFVDPEKLLAK